MHFASMSLGIFDFLINWLTDFLKWLVGWALDLFFEIFGNLIYDLASSILYIVDLIQLMFRKLCGMDTIWIGDAASEFVDPVMTVLTSDVVMQTLLTLSIVAVAMVIIASIIQVIRTEFSTEGSKNTKGQIFGKAIKSLIYFALVPVCCIGGIMISNVLLRTIDNATKGDTQATMGAQIAVSALSSCIEDKYKDKQSQVEELFLTGKLDYTATLHVAIYYHIGDCNFFILLGSAIIAFYMLATASFGLIMRIYYVSIYFIVSPPIVGLMPLTEAPFTQWRSAFIKQVLGAYGTVVTLNLMFQLMPIVNNINLFEKGNYGNDIAHILFTLTALFMMKDLPGKLANFIGAQDATETGKDAAKTVGGSTAKLGLAAMGGVAGLSNKVIGAGMSGIAKATGSKKWAAAANTFGGIGNKLWQKSKGTAGGVYNKTIGYATGGMVKGPFSEETDYEKAKKAKEAKDKERQERIDNGTAGIGDHISKGISDIPSNIAGDMYAHIANGDEHKAANDLRKSEKDEKKTQIKNLKKDLADNKIDEKAYKEGVKKAKSTYKTNMSVLDEMEQEQLDNKRNEFDYSKSMMSGFITSIATGGTSTTAKMGSAKLEAEAAEIGLKNVTGADGSLTKAYENLKNKVNEDKLNNVKNDLENGDRLGASDGLSEMINALNSIVQKSEEQNDLLTKLTTMRQQLDSGAISSSEMKTLAGGEGLKGVFEGVAEVQKQAENTFNISNDFKVSGGDVESEVNRLAEQIKSSTKQNVDGLKSQLLKTVKEELEKMKDKKGKK